MDLGEGVLAFLPILVGGVTLGEVLLDFLPDLGVVFDVLVGVFAMTGFS